MDLAKALINVAEMYKDNSNNLDYVEFWIFNELKKQHYIDLEEAPSVLFFECNQIRYRTVFNVGFDNVYNQYGFNELKSEVIPCDGDPKVVKAIIKKFVTELQDNAFDDTEICGYPEEPVDDLKTAEKRHTKKGNKMKDVFNKMLEVNKASAVNTAKVELGKSANKLVLTKVAPKLPMMMRGYADSPLAELVVANIVAGLLIQFMPDNEKAKVLSEAMISAGAQVAIESLDIPGLLNDLLANVDISGVDED